MRFPLLPDSSKDLTSKPTRALPSVHSSHARMHWVFQYPLTSNHIWSMLKMSCRYYVSLRCCFYIKAGHFVSEYMQMSEMHLSFSYMKNFPVLKAGVNSSPLKCSHSPNMRNVAGEGAAFLWVSAVCLWCENVMNFSLFLRCAKHSPGSAFD